MQSTCPRKIRVPVALSAAWTDLRLEQRYSLAYIHFALSLVVLLLQVYRAVPEGRAVPTRERIYSSP